MCNLVSYTSMSSLMPYSQSSSKHYFWEVGERTENTAISGFTNTTYCKQLGSQTKAFIHKLHIGWQTWPDPGHCLHLSTNAAIFPKSWNKYIHWDSTVLIWRREVFSISLFLSLILHPSVFIYISFGSHGAIRVLYCRKIDTLFILYSP